MMVFFEPALVMSISDSDTPTKNVTFHQTNVASRSKRFVEDKNKIILTVEFEKFTPQEVAKFAAYYRQYKGYESAQVLNQTSSLTSLLYTSFSSKELILNNLQKTANINGFKVLMRSVDDRIHIRLLSKTQNSLDFKEW